MGAWIWREGKDIGPKRGGNADDAFNVMVQRSKGGVFSIEGTWRRINGEVDDLSTTTEGGKDNLRKKKSPLPSQVGMKTHTRRKKMRGKESSRSPKRGGI